MTLYALLQLGYQIALAALTTLVILSGSSQMRRTMATVFAVMLAAIALAGWWPDVAYAWAMIGVDSLATIAICWHPAGKWQSAVGLTYVIQVIVHIGRLIVGDDADIFGYYWGLSTVAIAQLLLLGGWWLYDRVRRRRSGSDYHPPSADPRVPGMVR